jgi:hypothetical protein
MQNATAEMWRAGALEDAATLTTISLLISLTPATLKTWAGVTSSSMSVINVRVDQLDEAVLLSLNCWFVRRCS